MREVLEGWHKPSDPQSSVYGGRRFVVGETYRVTSPIHKSVFSGMVVEITSNRKPIFKVVDGTILPHKRFRETGTHVLEDSDSVGTVNHFNEDLFTV